LDERGGLILLADCNLPIIPLFDRLTDPSFVPAKMRAAGAEIGAPNQRYRRCISTSPFTAARTMARFRSLGPLLCAVTILALSMTWSGPTYAERASVGTDRASTSHVDRYTTFVTEASERFVVPARWIRAVMHVESAGKVRARSRKGAMGLMQIMPGTWADLRARYGLGADPYDSHDNILAGTAYIRELYDRYGAPGFLAAYNAGPGRYERHLLTGRSLPDETQAYVATLTPMLKSKRANVAMGAVARTFAWANSSLFATRTAGISPDDRLSADMHQNRSSRAHAVVDLSALVPQSGNIFVRLAREIRSQ
jgi:soluble lytic murein transglycosylase-like protein